ncbi:MAG: DUF2325 domain-containing protein [Pseudomonadota bacterium]
MSYMPFLPDTSATSESSLAEAVAALFPLNAGDESSRAEGEAVNRRKKLWEVGAGYHCAIVGTCLSIAELRRLARRAGINEWDSASDYELHHSAVQHARGRNALSALIQKALERKFALAVKRFAQARTDEEIRVLWREALARGEVAGALWAIMTHPLASECTLAAAGEELHMLLHQAGASRCADLRRLAELERENERLREQLQRQSGKSAEQLARKDALIAALERRAADAAAAALRLQEAQRRIRELEDNGALARAERALAAESLRAQRAEERAARIAEIEARCAQLERALAEARREREAAERALRGMLARLSRDGEGAARAACAADLSGRCVLCVGGRTGLVDQYRMLVEQCRGRFLHHDGGLENNLRRLQALLASADAVVCAAGNVSHAAYYAVKRFCKQDGKPCVLLRNPSLSSFVNGILALAGDGFDADKGDTVLIA